jgi:chloride channel 7
MSYKVAPDSGQISEEMKTMSKKKRIRKTITGKVDGRRGLMGSESQDGVFALLQGKFRNTKFSGARNIGGQAPTNSAKYSQYEAISYLKPDNVEVEKAALIESPDKEFFLAAALWVRYCVMGMVVSVVIFFALKICKTIEYARVKETTKQLDAGNVWGGWLYWVGTSIAMNLLACFLVLLQPAAASSGIPGLIAFLNGVEPNGGISPLTGKKTSFVSLKTMGAKFLGMLCSIPSGLCIGPEGPIIHISALLGYWSTHFVHFLEEKVLGKRFDHETEEEKRDFLASGAACGITTAFRAPLAGTLFVVEEAGSFFSTAHLEYTFFACLVSFWMQWMFGLFIDGDTGTNAKFQLTTGFYCDVDNPLNSIAYIIMAVLGGMLGAGFNQVVESLAHIRAEHVNTHGTRRLLEVIFLTMLTGTVVVLLPMNALCRPATRDVMLRDSAGCLPPEDFAQVSYGEVHYSYLSKVVNSCNAADNVSDSMTTSTRRLASGVGSKFYRYPVGGSGNVLDDLRNITKNARIADKSRYDTIHDTVILDAAADQGPYIHVHNEHSYTCGKKSHNFNDMAMLWLNGGVKGVKVLMQRGFPHLISIDTLWKFLIVYFLLASITAGTHVPAGLVVPMLLIGGAFGRLFGLYWMEFKKSLCENYVPLESSPLSLNVDLSTGDSNYNMYWWGMVHRWVIRDCKLPDPGTFAVIGMASFMGGSGRISVMLAVVMLELTGDASLVAPVGIVCILATLVGNWFNHGLYHGLIPVMNLPFLNAKPAKVMYVTRVVAIMSRHLVYLPHMCLPAELKALKLRIDRGMTHNAFPVVRTEFDRHLVGLLSRRELFQILEDLKDPIKAREICDETVDDRIDLTLYCDRSPLSVDWGMTVARAYELFTKMGLRHLIVLGHTGKVEGLVTRKDLMVFKMNRFKEVEIYWIRRMQAAIRHKLLLIGFYDDKPHVREAYEKSIREDKRDGIVNSWDDENLKNEQTSVRVFASDNGSTKLPEMGMVSASGTTRHLSFS